MVWTPDALVTEFCTRDSSPDASNRARYHCNACAAKFPLGSVREMRDHLLNCPSLSLDTIASIKERMRNEKTTPKRVMRDPRWTTAEEKTLLKLDAELDGSKTGQRYKKMAATIGRSAQACRQKLIHLKENQAVRDGEVETTKRVLWNRKTREGKIKREPEDDEEDLMPIDINEASRPVRRSTRRGRWMQEATFSLSDHLRADADATSSDVESVTYRTASATMHAGATMSATADEFLRLLRWHIHDALTKYEIVKGFYRSDLSIKDGWGVFVASDIPQADKDQIVARLIGLWLDGLNTDGFEVEVDLHVEDVVRELSEWTFEGGNPMVKAIEEFSTEEEEDSGYEADGSYVDDGCHEAMEF